MSPFGVQKLGRPPSRSVLTVVNPPFDIQSGSRKMLFKLAPAILIAGGMGADYVGLPDKIAPSLPPALRLTIFERVDHHPIKVLPEYLESLPKPEQEEIRRAIEDAEVTKGKEYTGFSHAGWCLGLCFIGERLHAFLKRKTKT